MTTTRLAIIETATAQTDGPFCCPGCVQMRSIDLDLSTAKCRFGYNTLDLRLTEKGHAIRHFDCLAAEQRAKEMGL